MSLHVINHYAQRIIELEIKPNINNIKTLKEEIIFLDQDIRDAIEEEVLDFFDMDIMESTTIRLIFFNLMFKKKTNLFV